MATLIRTFVLPARLEADKLGSCSVTNCPRECSQRYDLFVVVIYVARLCFSLWSGRLVLSFDFGSRCLGTPRTCQNLSRTDYETTFSETSQIPVRVGLSTEAHGSRRSTRSAPSVSNFKINHCYFIAQIVMRLSVVSKYYQLASFGTFLHPTLILFNMDLLL